MNNERDADGKLTPLALALRAIIEDGCSCDSVDDEPHTCLAGLCADALKDQFDRLNAAHDLIAKMQRNEIVSKGGMVPNATD